MPSRELPLDGESGLAHSKGPERIRDPLHNLIEFHVHDPEVGRFEDGMWRVLQTRPFQRLRRIKQLGFSELVYPGASHTRFAHSLGVFHTARQLLDVIRYHQRLNTQRLDPDKEQTALAAALVHDVGHGPFSHAFEEVGKRLQLPMARHEDVSDPLIRDGEIAEILKDVKGSGFADDVADVVRRDGPSNLYDAVVSSQFDADRLDYMRRDLLMTGTQSGAIDFEWLTKNLEVARLSRYVDDERVGDVDTFVLGPKAFRAAETYVHGLFQLYPSVYFHKTTRGFEKILSALLVKLKKLVDDNAAARSGLATNHPLICFLRGSDSLDRALALDDTVVWGALEMMVEAEDQEVAGWAMRLRDRKVMKCIDIRETLIHDMFPKRRARDEAGAEKRIALKLNEIQSELQDWSNRKAGDCGPRVLIDEGERHPYKQIEETKGPLNQIHIRLADGTLSDMAEQSHVVNALPPFRMFRAYVDRNDSEAEEAVRRAIKAHVQGAGTGNG